MLFNSVSFLAFFPTILIIYFLIPSRSRKIFLLAASYFFYMCWNPRYAVLIAASTITTFLVGIGIEKIRSKKAQQQKEKLLLGIGIFFNLAILVFFKYINFIWSNICIVLNAMHIYTDNRYFDIILPVGISFYTFQALSYVIDVYREKVKAEKNFVQYALFVSFFPQLVAGPIERSSNLLKQINNVSHIRLFDYNRITDGFKTMLYGYFLKMVVADRIAGYVNVVFGDYRSYNSTVLIIASSFFAIQIYCDFNSYSLIAIGSAKVLGFELMENFDAPYFSHSVSEFWRRWHISLNTWFRDYLYIPLGGSRCSKIRHAFNILAVFLTSGLWHGANWTYFMWGGANGVYQIVERLLRPAIDFVNRKLHTKVDSFSYKLAQTLITFVLVDFSWIFFRANTVGDAFRIIERIFTRWDPWIFSGENIQNILPAGISFSEFNIALISIIFIAIVDALKYTRGKDLNMVLSEQCIWFRWGIYIMIFVSIVVYGLYGANFESIDFIYFQF